MANFFKYLQILKYVRQFILWVQSYINNKSPAESVKNLDDASKKIDNSNQIADDAARLKLKQEAASEIEKSLSGN